MAPKRESMPVWNCLRESGAPIDGFIRRPNVGFRTKAADLSSGEIREEVRPGDVLRTLIVDLAEQSRACAIVSSSNPVADTALLNWGK